MKTSPQFRLEWIFRIAVAMEFIGHGAFGIITKQAWVAYFGVVGIPEPWAWKLMPMVGTVDILLGLTALFRPCRAALLYMTVWGLWTALPAPAFRRTVLGSSGACRQLRRSSSLPAASQASAGLPGWKSDRSRNLS